MSGDPGLYETRDWDPVLENTIHPGGLRLTETMAHHLGTRGSWQILDVGCGRGTTAGFLAKEYGCRVVGIDRSQLLLTTTDERGYQIVGDAASLPFGPAAFDAAISECCLSLLTDKESAVREIYRVLRSNAKLAIADVFLRGEISAGLRTQAAARSCVAGAMKLEEYTELLLRAGFENPIVEDCSKELLKAAWRIVSTYGTFEKFLSRLGPYDADTWRQMFRQGRPGYALIVTTRP